MGAVFRGLDRRLGREVAIKFTHLEERPGFSPSEMLVQEARRMAEVRHPNVVPVYDFGEHEGRGYLVMHFHRGADLDDWAAARGGPPLGLDESLGLLQQICRGVVAIHDAGIVHHDLKPANILVGDAYEVAITDLGLAARGRLDYGGVAGTPGYVAPEAIVGDEVPAELADRADVYAIGMLAYWMLAGALPVEGIDCTEVFANQVAGDIPLLSQMVPDIPLLLDGVLASAVAREPGSRPSASELLELLTRARRVFLDLAPGIDTRVVLVDDDEDIQTLVADALENAFDALDVVVFSEPHEALRHIEAMPPDLVVTDIEMPGLNGIELTARLRGNVMTRNVPIIVLTAVGGAPEWQTLHRIGATSFIVKPLDVWMLIDAVRRATGARLRAPPTA